MRVDLRCDPSELQRLLRALDALEHDKASPLRQKVSTALHRAQERPGDADTVIMRDEDGSPTVWRTPIRHAYSRR